MATRRRNTAFPPPSTHPIRRPWGDEELCERLDGLAPPMRLAVAPGRYEVFPPGVEGSAVVVEVASGREQIVRLPGR